jgi:hypothetical protein
MSVSYEELFTMLKLEIDNLAKAHVDVYYNEAISDGYYILAELRNDIEDWCEMLDTGDIDDGNFKALLFDEVDRFKMMALRKAGLTVLELEDFRTTVFKLICTTVIRVVRESQASE